MSLEQDYDRVKTVLGSLLSRETLRQLAVRADQKGPTVAFARQVMLNIAWRKLIAAVAAAWIVTGILAWLFSPSVPDLDRNLKAYALLTQDPESGRMLDLLAIFDEAYQIAEDPDLRYFAEYFIRLIKHLVLRGADTTEELKSVSGLIEGIIKGTANPVLAWEGVGLFIDEYSVRDTAEQLEAKYGPQLEAHQSSLARKAIMRKISWWMFWILIGVATMLLAARSWTAVCDTMDFSQGDHTKATRDYVANSSLTDAELDDPLCTPEPLKQKSSDTVPASN